MSAESEARFKRLEPLIDRALDLEGSARDTFLAMCGEIHPDLIADLRRALSMGDDALPGLGPLAAEVTRERTTDRRGLRAGAWRLSEKLGRGGMGTVYVAERADGAFEMRVAVKLLRSHDSRFKQQLERERRVLARLDHPGIARLLDGGVMPDGQPYLAMELAEGRDLDRWLQQERPPLAQRLRVFLAICDAVAYAHGVLVVHRDLKPSNIRVDQDGSVKLLDFGIAKLLEPDAERGNTQHLALTPDFAAPEQLRGGEISTRTDVYALGALLYLMLTGRFAQPAFDGDWVSFVRRVTEEDAPAPSRAAADTLGLRLPAAQLRGDLDAIVAQALRRDPLHRYASVEALAADIRRYQGGRPVLAHPGSWHYRGGKWMRRHWLGASIAAAVTLALLAGVAGVVWQARETAAERDAALLEARRSEAVRAMLLLMFRDAAQTRGVDNLSVRELFDGRTAQIETEFADDPVTRQQVLSGLAEIYIRIADYAGARAVLRRFFELEDGSSPVRLRAQALTDLANAELRSGDVGPACERIEQALQLFASAQGDSRGLRADALGIRGQCQRAAGRIEASIEAYREALMLRTLVSGPDSRDTATAHNNLGLAYYFGGRIDEALPQLQRALALFDANGQGRSLDAANTLNNLAALSLLQGQLPQAEALFARALAQQREVAGESAALGALLNNQGRLMLLLGHLEPAKAALDESLALQQRYAGDDSPDVAATLLTMGELALLRGQLDQATMHFERAHALFEARFGPDHLYSARAQLAQATLLAKRRQFDASESLYANALARLEQAGPQGAVFAALGRCARGSARLQRDDAAGAADDAQHCRDQLAATRPADHYDRLQADALFAATREPRDASARAAHAAAIAALGALLGQDNPRVIEAAGWMK